LEDCHLESTGIVQQKTVEKKKKKENDESETSEVGESPI
jgi:hypothetical protein